MQKTNYMNNQSCTQLTVTNADKEFSLLFTYTTTGVDYKSEQFNFSSLLNPKSERTDA